MEQACPSTLFLDKNDKRKLMIYKLGENLVFYQSKFYAARKLKCETNERYRSANTYILAVTWLHPPELNLVELSNQKLKRLNTILKAHLASLMLPSSFISVCEKVHEESPWQGTTCHPKGCYYLLFHDVAMFCTCRVYIYTTKTSGQSYIFLISTFVVVKDE